MQEFVNTFTTHGNIVGIMEEKMIQTKHLSSDSILELFGATG